VAPRILAFRPRERIHESLEQAQELGVELRVIPLIAARYRRSEELQKFLGDLEAGKVDYAVFSSPSSFRSLMRHVGASADAVREHLTKSRIVAIGDRTAAELEEAGLNTSRPVEFSSRGLLDYLKGQDLRGRSVYLLRSSEGTAELPEGLAALGARVRDVALYRLRPISHERVFEELRDAVLEGGFQGYAFTSSMTVHTFFSVFEEAGLLDEALTEVGRKVVGAIGRPTEEALLRRGIHSLRPPRASFRELLGVMRERILAKTL
jgi:uroporphyrinogen-III synthase